MVDDLSRGIGTGTVVVTGAGGYVGQNLVSALLDAGHRVRALDRVTPQHADLRAEWSEVDVLDPAAVADALAGADLVYHLAAKITLAEHDPVAWTVNTVGVRVVAEAALTAGVRRMVHASSMASFDLSKCNGRLVETSPRATDPGLPVYGRSKLAGERAFLDVLERGLDGVVCYPTALVGPHDRGAALSQVNAVLLSSARGRLPVLIGGSLDLVDVRDVATGLMQAAERGRTGESYFLGGRSVELVEALRDVARLVGRRGPRGVLPMRLVRAVAPAVVRLSRSPGHPLSRHSLDTIEQSPVVDSSKAASELGYSARPLDVSLADLVRFFRAEGHLPPTTSRCSGWPPTTPTPSTPGTGTASTTSSCPTPASTTAPREASPRRTR